MGGVGGVEVWMLGEPCLAVGVPKGQGGVVVDLCLSCGVATHGVIDHPAGYTADEDRQGGGDAEIGADSEGEGATPRSSTTMTMKTPSRTRVQGSLRERMPLMTVAIRR